MRFFAVLLLLSACGDDAAKPDCKTSACTLSHDFGVQMLAAGQEHSDLCQSWTLHNTTDLWVNAVVLDNDGGYHHSNWTFVHENVYNVPDSAWDCSTNGFSETAGALSGGVLYAQSTQAKHEVQQFPPGVALRVPAFSRIIGSTHLLNASGGPLTTDLRMQIQAIPAASVVTDLKFLRMQYHDLHIPAQSQAEFSMSCDFATPYQQMVGTPFDMKVYYILPHYHSLGTRLDVKLFGGPQDGQVIFQHFGYDGQPGGRTYNPPIDVSGTGAVGLTMTCAFDNPRDVPVGWGIGDQEMCVSGIFADMGFTLADGEANDGTGMVTSMQGTTVYASAPCVVHAL
jgi:hypothetical protein